MTIKEELEQIASVCITSEEYTERAKRYLKEEKGMKQDIMNDEELRDIYREVNRKREVEKCWEKYDKTILPALYKRTECKGLYYETWIDLDESWEEKWFSSFQYMKDDEIVDVCVKYLNQQERFYSSPDYYDMLNKMIANLE